MIDGIIAACERLSEAAHRSDKLRELTATVVRETTTCGSCGHWMKSRSCPRERPRGMTGYYDGPADGDFKCASYVQSERSASDAANAREQIAKMGSPDWKEGL